MAPANLVLQEEEPKKGEDSTVQRPRSGSLELCKCWNMGKCVPIENVAIRTTTQLSVLLLLGKMR